MRPIDVPLHTVPFADRLSAHTLSLADVEDLGPIADPRWHDLPEDAHLWLGLLATAYEHDGDAADGLFGAIHGLRCLGARLHRTRAGLRIAPGELSRNEYARLREMYLLPHAGILRRLLAVPQSMCDVETISA